MLQQAHHNIRCRQQQQRQQQQQLHAADSAGLQELAALLTWPHCQQQHCWPASLLIKLQGSMQCWGRRWRHDQHSCTAAAAVARQDAANASSGSSVAVLPGLLQHLLGVVAAALLLRHWSALLLLGAAAGGWLQQQVLQPHIEWLMQAHPGERCSCVATCVLLAELAG
jgi:hypothetical protein